MIHFIGAFLLTAALLGCGTSTKRTDTTLGERLSRLLELPTAEFRYKDIIYLGREESFLFFKTVDKRLLFSVTVRVTAGPDLEEGVSVETDFWRPGRVRVRLPRPKILSIDADEASIREYFAVERGKNIQRLEFADEIERVKPLLSADAVDRGILTRARDNARELIRRFLDLAGFDTVIFEDPPI